MGHSPENPKITGPGFGFLGFAGVLPEDQQATASRNELILGFAQARVSLDSFQRVLQTRLEDRERWTPESRVRFLDLKRELEELDEKLDGLNRRLATFL